MTEVDRDQALAFRVAGQHLHERTDPMTALAACGLQEYPPGWSRVALHARAHGEPDRRQTVTVNAMRGSPYVVPRRDVAIFTTALVPDDDEHLDALVGKAPAGKSERPGSRSETRWSRSAPPPARAWPAARWSATTSTRRGSRGRRSPRPAPSSSGASCAASDRPPTPTSRPGRRPRPPTRL